MDDIILVVDVWDLRSGLNHRQARQTVDVLKGESRWEWKDAGEFWKSYMRSAYLTQTQLMTLSVTLDQSQLVAQSPTLDKKPIDDPSSYPPTFDTNIIVDLPTHSGLEHNWDRPTHLGHENNMIFWCLSSDVVTIQ